MRLRNEMDTNHKAQLDDICTKHDKIVDEIRSTLLKTQEESARVASENAQYKKHVDVLLGKNETLQDMSEIQSEEISRLRGLPDEKQKFLNTQQQVSSLASSVD